MARAAGPARAILVYHRIAAPRYDTWDLAVSPATFAERLGLIAAEFRPLPLDELVAVARRGKLPPRGVAVTFDDGYVDNLESGLPELERHGVPATIYVTTGYVGERRLFWWDELEDLLRGPGPRPERLELGLLGRRLILPTSTPEECRAALLQIQPQLRRGPRTRIADCLEVLRGWAGRPAEAAVNGVRAVNPDELLRRTRAR